jgi:hypothetical protein
VKSENEGEGKRKRGGKKGLVRRIEVRVDNIVYGNRREMSTKL